MFLLDFYRDMPSLILSQILGLFFVLTSIVMVARIEYFRAVINKSKSDDLAVQISACFTLLISLVVVTMNNHWVLDPSLTVTIAGWLLFVIGMLWFALPECMLAWTQKCYAGNGYYLVMLFLFLFGALLLARGYYPFSAGAGWQPFR